jgi:hypothetical protein
LTALNISKKLQGRENFFNENKTFDIYFFILNSNSPVKMLQVLKISFYFELERDYAIQEMLKITI